MARAELDEFSRSFCESDLGTVSSVDACAALADRESEPHHALVYTALALVADGERARASLSSLAERTATRARARRENPAREKQEQFHTRPFFIFVCVAPAGRASSCGTEAARPAMVHHTRSQSAKPSPHALVCGLYPNRHTRTTMCYTYALGVCSRGDTGCACGAACASVRPTYGGPPSDSYACTGAHSEAYKEEIQSRLHTPSGQARKRSAGEHSLSLCHKEG